MKYSILVSQFFFMMTTQMYSSWNALRESVFEAWLEVSFLNDKT